MAEKVAPESLQGHLRRFRRRAHKPTNLFGSKLDVNAILGKLEVEGPFRAMLLEYVADGPPATEIGAAEAAWMKAGATS